jgi:hypothetical protein
LQNPIGKLGSLKIVMTHTQVHIDVQSVHMRIPPQ